MGPEVNLINVQLVNAFQSNFDFNCTFFEGVLITHRITAIRDD